MKYTKFFLVAVLLFGIGGFIYQHTIDPFFSTPKFSSVSPSGKFKADVYAESSAISMPGQGGAGGKSAEIILRNKDGKKIGSNDGCEVIMDDVKIEWEEKNNLIFFAKAKSINLTDGKCEE